MGDTTKWAGTQYLPFLSLILVIILAVGGFVDRDDQNDDIDNNAEYATDNRKMIEALNLEGIEDALESQAEEMAIQLQKNANFLDRIETLENAPAAPQTSISVLTQNEKTQILNDIASLKSKMTAAERNIDDLEDDINDNSRSTTSSTIRANIEPSCDEDDLPTSPYGDVSMDRITGTILRGDDITITGVGDPRERIQLWVCAPDERRASSGGSITISSNGLWTISCSDRICADEIGEHIAFVEILDSQEYSRIRDYEVER